MRTLLILLALIGTIATGARAADIGLPFEIRFHREDFSDDLTQQSITQLFQDSRGLIWILTQEGLNSYDGIKLQHFTHSSSDPTTIPQHLLTRIAEDHSGILWLSTLGGGLTRFDPTLRTAQTLKHQPENPQSPLSDFIATIFTDHDGILWLGYDSGLSRFDPDEGTFRHFQQQMSRLSDDLGVYGFAQTADGTIWAATNEGLLEIDTATDHFQLHGRLNDGDTTIELRHLFGVMADSSDRLWLVSHERPIHVVDTAMNPLATYSHDPDDPSSLSSPAVNDLYEDFDGRFWIATDQGVNLLNADTQRFRHFSIEDEADNSIWSVIQSHDGTYWLGSYLGVASGHETLFAKVDRLSSRLSSNSINAFAETDDGTLWV
ncbi:MAG: two-component regulator propeller domain-containing protein, partial [Pseudomonadota bacterium]